MKMKTSTNLIMIIFMALASILSNQLVASYRHEPINFTIEDVRDHVIIKAAVDVNNNMTALQKHVSFFDRNHDGIINIKETFEGFRAIGAGIAVSTASSTLIHQSLSQKTRPGKSPSLVFPIEVSHIKLAKHGSDSGAFDNEGMFVEGKYEEIFTKYALTYKSALTEDELGAMLNGNKVPAANDTTAGSNAASSEWKMLFSLCKDNNGLLQKETVKALYDGTLFYEMEKMNKKTK